MKRTEERGERKRRKYKKKKQERQTDRPAAEWRRIPPSGVAVVLCCVDVLYWIASYCIVGQRSPAKNPQKTNTRKTSKIKTGRGNDKPTVSIWFFIITDDFCCCCSDVFFCCIKVRKLNRFCAKFTRSSCSASCICIACWSSFRLIISSAFCAFLP